MKWLTAGILGLLLVLTSCGVSRSESQDSLAAEVDVTSTEVVDVTDDTSGDEDHAGDATATTVAPEPTPTPTTAPAGDVALSVDFGDETWELTHGELNEIIVPTWENQEFVTRAFGGAIPPGFYTGVANEFLIGKVFDRELAKLNGTITPADEQQAKDGLLGIMQSWFVESADPTADANNLFDEVPYLPFVVGLQATQAAMTNALTESGELSVVAPCVRHILVDEESTALEVLGLLNDGGDFATLAGEYSTGPTGPNGGDLGCSPSSGYVPEFADAVDNAEIGEFVGPVQTQFGWNLIVVESFGESQADATQAINDRVGAALESLSIEIDPRVGTWDEASRSILPVASE